MPTAAADLSPTVLFTILASTIFSTAVAQVVGPYIVIAIGAMGGAAVALLMADSMGRSKAFLFFFGSTTMALLLTVSATSLVTLVFTTVQDHWLFAPISFGLGFLGDKWSTVFGWAGSKINAFIDILIQLRGPKP